MKKRVLQIIPVVGAMKVSYDDEGKSPDVYRIVAFGLFDDGSIEPALLGEDRVWWLSDAAKSVRDYAFFSLIPDAVSE